MLCFFEFSLMCLKTLTRMDFARIGWRYFVPQTACTHIFTYDIVFCFVRLSGLWFLVLRGPGMNAGVRGLVPGGLPRHDAGVRGVVPGGLPRHDAGVRGVVPGSQPRHECRGRRGWQVVRPGMNAGGVAPDRVTSLCSTSSYPP